MFQSAPPRGRRPGLCAARLVWYVFQSAPPRGRRLPTLVTVALPRRFQSAPPRGRRHQRSPRSHLGAVVSIRASAREATIGSRAWSSGRSTFQSAPPRGRRRRDRIALLKNVNSADLREPRYFCPGTGRASRLSPSLLTWNQKVEAGTNLPGYSCSLGVRVSSNDKRSVWIVARFGPNVFDA